MNDSHTQNQATKLDVNTSINGKDLEQLNVSS